MTKGDASDVRKGRALLGYEGQHDYLLQDRNRAARDRHFARYT